jgi:SAM-dependent methyltransferase
MNQINHYSDHYWNEIPQVLSYLCHRSTGDETLWWMDYIKKRYASPSRDHALIIGCGNGWVERDLYDRKIAKHFDAFDGSEHYLEEAKANKGDRAISYFQADFNSFVPERKYDLIVNVAALHHVAYLYRFTSRLANALTPYGIFVNWDYVGPSRNQYSAPQVQAMLEANEALPEHLRTPHPLKPSLFEMLMGDPTEAVHAADIFHAVEQHFEFIERRDLGGAIAYQLLWNNIEGFVAADDEKARQALNELLEQDSGVTDSRRLPTLFSFFVCRARNRRDLPRSFYRRFIFEPLREAAAKRLFGLYPSELLALASESPTDAIKILQALHHGSTTRQGTASE